MSTPEEPKKPSLSILEILLDQDGIRLPRGGGAEKAINCFRRDHEDKTASMSVNVAKGLFNCHGCGFSGNAYQYLTDARGLRCLSSADAQRVLREAGGTDQYVRAAVSAAAEADRRARREPRSTKEPCDEARVQKNLMADRVALYDYVGEVGKLLFKVGRYEATLDDGKVLKTFRSFTPKPDGSGYWVVDPLSEELEAEHRIPAYPIYRLPVIAEAVRSWEGKPDATKQQIWVVEGEKCANFVARLKSPAGLSPLVCSLYGPTKSSLIKNHDLSIFHGQQVLLIADADEQGRKYMRQLGRRLVKHCEEVRFLQPPGEDTYDIGDAAAGGWAEMLAFIKKVGVKSADEVLRRGGPPEHRNCQHCGKPFVFLKGKREKYCDMECYNAARRGIPPT